MTTIFDTAKYILHKSGKTNLWKLQKLCYYAQAWEIAWTKTPLFEEDCEAWDSGPVYPSLLQELKGKFIIGENDLKHGNPGNLTNDQKNDIGIILRDYGNMKPYELKELAKSENPWKQARSRQPEKTACNAIITKGSMGMYYRRIQRRSINRRTKT